MLAKYSLFNSHLDLAHQYWANLLRPGDTVIDATCGNGHDTLFLSTLVLKESFGAVFAIDKQEKAIENCKEKLTQAFPEIVKKQIHLYNQCHSSFPAQIQPNSVKLIVYNLGYLPGGNKTLTTEWDSSLESLIAAQDLIQKGGVISMTCYSGHESGKIEEAKILDYAASLDPKEWSCCHHRFLNRKLAPSLILFQKSHFVPITA